MIANGFFILDDSYNIAPTIVAFKYRKHQRIKSPAQFKQVYNNRQWGNTRLLTFNALSDLSLVDGVSQLGVTVSKKVSKLAVRRNHLKRLVREFYRHHQNELEQTKVVITVKPGARDASNQEINAELVELWAKLLKWQRWNYHQRKRHQATD